MLSEIQCWRALADKRMLPAAPPTQEDLPAPAPAQELPSSKKRKRDDAEEDQTDALRQQLEESRAACAEAQSSLREVEAKRVALQEEVAALKKDVASRTAAGRKAQSAVDDMKVQCELREQAAKKREHDAQRLGEKYRTKRRNLGQVLDARQEIKKLCGKHPELMASLSGLLTKWKSEHVPLSPETVLYTGASRASSRALRQLSIPPSNGPPGSIKHNIFLDPPEEPVKKQLTYE
eukprot:TRINITY_DN24700_c0_g1_i1.p1 TRINITY_DN24700_c0_g1~~TRINITY_DN24700_c0_g1_i1.p1  ORF type:complete len:276 (+),score=117.43 TRINITY_DN24700_c0_g1_i1:124-828(+)